MSLDRFTNRIQLVENHISSKGRVIEDSRLDIMTYDTAEISNVVDITNVTKRDIVSIESHIYNFKGKYVSSIYKTPYVFKTNTDTFYINYAQLFNQAGIRNGTYKVSTSFLINLVGSDVLKYFSLKESSSTGTELHFVVKNISEKRKPQFNKVMRELANTVASLREKGLVNDLVVNFGENSIFTVLNIAITEDYSSIFCKISQPLTIGVNINDSAYFSLKILDDYVNSVVVEVQEPKVTSKKLKGPRFDLEIPESSGTTVARSWDTLLDVQAPTATKLIGEILSGSRSIPLNIDYSNYSNFVMYGQAEDRVKNFDYKLDLIEYYTSQSNALTDSNVGTIAASITNKLRYDNRVYSIKNNFDDFEKYLYYDTGSIFTHGDEGNQFPTPKFVREESNVTEFHHYPRSASMYVDWYSSSLAYAQTYDKSNYDSLYWQTPDHVLRDDSNSQYVVFLSMIGQHFDNLYTYIRELTSIHRRDEHPKRGIPNKLLPIYAESLGWLLQDTNQLSNLWLYKLGVNNSGSYATPTGSLASTAHEHLSNQIWRRIVNNLPLILKTKGTDRAVKALIASYGIPQTLISIKEYGGPRIDSNKPNFIEDRFAYILNFNSDQYIEVPRRPVTSSLSTIPQVPQTVEFRFRTRQTGSVSMSLWAVEDYSDRNNVLQNLELVHFSADTTGSFNHYSGSRDYGYLRYTGTYYSASTLYESPAVSSSFLPLFDHDLWTVRMHSTEDIYSGSLFDGTINIDVQKASNCTDKRISVSSSFSSTHSVPSELLYTLGATASLANTPHRIVIGGTTGSALAGTNATRFSGSIHGYKEYFESYSKSVFDEHTLNPAAYYTDTYSSSYDNLFRYYPLGLDNIRFDHNVVTEISSSHPNRNFMIDTSASLHNFTQIGAKQYDSLQEVYYIYVPSIGANNLKSERIRIDPSSNRYDLSPTRRSEKSLYDSAQQDSNRLAIVFSPTDQINRDIVNNFGFLDFDDILGNPQDTKKPYYAPIRPLQHDYWKKYVADSNFNTFIRIFGLYDYTLFEQIKQLIPARANYIGGILLENTIIERPKVIRKYPTLSRLDLEGNLVLGEDEIEICYNYLSSSIDMPDDIDIVYSYKTSSIEVSSDIEMLYTYHSSSIKSELFQPYITHQYNSSTIYTSVSNLEGNLPGHNLTDNTDNLGDFIRIGDSLVSNESAVSDFHQDNSTFLEDVISTSNLIPSLQDSHVTDFNQNNSTFLEGALVLEEDFYYTGGTVYSHLSTGEEEKKYSYKDSNGVTQNVTGSFRKLYPNEGVATTVIGNMWDNIDHRIENEVGQFIVISSSVEIPFTVGTLSEDDSYLYRYTSSAGEISASLWSFTAPQFREFLSKYKYIASTRTSKTYREKSQGELYTIHTGSRLVSQYSKVIYHYSSSGRYSDPFLRGYEVAYSQSMNLYYSRSLAPTGYQYDEDSVKNRIRFTGCKLTGPAVNEVSLETVDNLPVVEVREVNDAEFTV